MSTERVAELFAGCVELAPEERSRYLDTTAAGETENRLQVERLLEAYDAAGGFLDGPLDPSSIAELVRPEESSSDAVEREQIGPYALVREVGRGGMGTVYLAERADGGFEQRVALKVIQQGADSEARVRRFLYERQILARLEHPFIARLYDGGLASDGRPYFAMEYVDGMPITRWCAEQEASLDRRIRLLADVCRAVQHAHASLIVHRDLKPSNVLVTEAGEVKLLDFGIASLAADAGEVAMTLPATAEGAMTPQYASPEQFRGDPITTASDVYQLGLLAYELVAGRRPYELRGASPQAASQAVCERMPDPPSRSTTGARADGLDDFGSLPAGNRRRRALSDLDTIVLKALQKEPAARYASANHLRADLERYLSNEPISARAPTLAYRGRKLVGRHPVAAAGIVAGVLLVILLSALFTVRLVRERDRTRLAAEIAEEHRRESEEVTVFLLELFEVADPAREGRTVTARELLDRGASRIERELEDQPLVQARLLHSVGSTYRRLGLYPEAERLLRRASTLQEASAASPVEVARTIEDLALVLIWQGRYDVAETELVRALALYEHHLGAGDRAVGRMHYHLGNLRRQQGALEEAESHLRRAEEILEGVEGSDDGLAEVVDGLGMVLRARGTFDEAAAMHERAIELLERSAGGESPRLAAPLNNLATLHSGLGRHELSLPLFQRAYRIHAAAYGADYPKAFFTLNNIGIDLLELGRLAEAEETFALVEPAVAAHLGESHAAVANVVLNRGNVALERGDGVAAEDFYRRSLAIFQDALSAGHPQIGLALNNLGEALVKQGRLEEASATFERSLALFEAALGPEHLYVSWPALHLGRIWAVRGDPARAESLLRRAVEIRRRDLEPGSEDLREAEAAMAQLERTPGR